MSTTAVPSAVPSGCWAFAPIDPNDSAAAWLADGERVELATWKHPRRRAAWIAGRRLARTLIRHAAGPAPGLDDDESAMEILSRDEAGKSNRPRIMVAGREQSGSLSLSHSGNWVLAAYTARPNLTVGCDLQRLERVGRGFAELWCGRDEPDVRSPVTGDPLSVVQLWALKEAVYKATNRGRPFAPQRTRIAVSQQHLIGHCDGRDAVAGVAAWTLPDADYVAAFAVSGDSATAIAQLDEWMAASGAVPLPMTINTTH